jgi:hypothetical protein
MDWPRREPANTATMPSVNVGWYLWRRLGADIHIDRMMYVPWRIEYESLFARLGVGGGLVGTFITVRETNKGWMGHVWMDGARFLSCATNTCSIK